MVDMLKYLKSVHFKFKYCLCRSVALLLYRLNIGKQTNKTISVWIKKDKTKGNYMKNYFVKQEWE